MWKKILMHRTACDQMVKKMGGISFMISAITGMVAKSPIPGVGKIACPGVSYWAVLESREVDPRAMTRHMQGSFQGQAEVKLLQEPPLITTMETMHSTLCTVMKDHSNTYIKRRLAESDAESGIGTGSRLAARFVVVKPNSFANDFTQLATESLQKEGISVDLFMS